MATLMRRPLGIVVMRFVADGFFGAGALLAAVGDRLVGRSNAWADRWNREHGVYDPPIRNEPSYTTSDGRRW